MVTRLLGLSAGPAAWQGGCREGPGEIIQATSWGLCQHMGPYPSRREGKELTTPSGYVLIRVSTSTSSTVSWYRTFSSPVPPPMSYRKLLQFIELIKHVSRPAGTYTTIWYASSFSPGSSPSPSRLIAAGRAAHCAPPVASPDLSQHIPGSRGQAVPQRTSIGQSQE